MGAESSSVTIPHSHMNLSERDQDCVVSTGQFSPTTTSVTDSSSFVDGAFSFFDEAADSPWKLGDNDLKAIYSEYCFSELDSYLNSFPAAEDMVNCEILNHMSPVHEHFMTDNAHVSSLLKDTFDWDAFGSTSEQVYLYECPDQYDVAAGPEERLLEFATPPKLVYAVDAKGNTVPLATALMMVKSVQGVATSRLLRVLFDSGGSVDLAHRRICPQGTSPDRLLDATMVRTLAGCMTPLGELSIEGMKLPEFDSSRLIDNHRFQVFDGACDYDLILGAGFLKKIGIKLDYVNEEVDWLGARLPMNTRGFTKQRLLAFVDAYHLQLEEELFAFDDSFATSIADAKYEAVDTDVVVEEQCTHLTPQQQDELKEILRRHEQLFSGKLGKYVGPEMDVELLPDARPVFRRPYPIPHVYLETFKKELEHLVSLGVLKPIAESSWALPTFITPKKPEPDGTRRVRWVSDLRELNKQIVRTNYVLPVITDVLRKHHGFKFCTKIDVSMQFYAFPLTERARKLCRISTPFGLYEYQRAPMGLANSPSHAQAAMMGCLSDLENVDCYIDDIGIFTKTWEEHCRVLSEVLKRLEDKGFTVNPTKCAFAVQETDWLGYELTPEGIKPWRRKIEAILKLRPPRNTSEARSLVGMINFFRDCYPRRAHMLAPFTALTNPQGSKRSPINWTPELDKAFKELKAVLAKDALMAFPNHNKPFSIYCNASDYQLGACIMQEGKVVAYYSRKLSSAERNYSTIEKELLAIVMTLKEYRSMLLGADISIYSDHRNLSFAGLNTQRVLRWRSMIEEFAPKIYYIPGKENVLADAFSRLPRFDGDGAVERNDALDMTPIELDAGLSAFFADNLIDGDYELAECLSHFSYVNAPSTDSNPLRYSWIRESQQMDADLLQCLQSDPAHFQVRNLQDTELICFNKNPEEDDWKICLTDQTLDPTIEFFHQLLNHPSHNVLLSTMRLFYHPSLSERARSFACDTCQRVKSGTRGVGHFPPREVNLAPWQQVDIDLIGPWRVETRTKGTLEFYALTCIDRTTGFPDAVRIDRKTALEVSNKFNECWLSRYPRPEFCCHDKGGEFTGPEFKELLHNLAISDVPTTSRNPTANGICERMHLSVANSLRAQLSKETPRTIEQAKKYMDLALATALYSVRTNVSEATGNSPGALAFRRDMIFNLPLEFDFEAINERRQLRVDADLLRINSKRYSYDYQVGERVLKRKYEYAKLDERWEGPFEVLQVHVNGNVTIQLRDGVSERINIRRVKPYKEPTPSVL